MRAEFGGKVGVSKFPGHLVIEDDEIYTRTILDRWTGRTSILRSQEPTLRLRERPLSCSLTFQLPGMVFDQELFTTAPCNLAAALEASGWWFLRV